MQNIIIIVKDLPDIRKAIQTIITKSIFISPSKDCFIINPSLNKVTIDFKGSPFIDINTLAYLALFIRTLAENNIKVVLIWPSKFKGSPSSMHRYLVLTGFAKLFSLRISSSLWLKNISSEGNIYLDLYDDNVPSETNYIKLQWFDESVFDYDKNSNIWHVTPILKKEFRSSIEDVMLQQGFINTSVIDVFFKIIFKEIGWNIVLHSSEIPGSGYGIFGAQISPNKILSFSLSDFGKSIPFTLNKNYPQKKLNWESSLAVSSKAAILRYALEKNSSSRPSFPSLADQKAFRGLTLVANSLNLGSEIEFISNGGSVVINGRQLRSKAKVSDLFSDSDYPGTFILGTLSQHSYSIPLESYSTRKPVTKNLPILRCYNLNGSHIDKKDFNKIMSNYNKMTSFKTFHLDIGFSDHGIRFLEYIVIDFVESNLNNCEYLFVWNVTSDWSQFQYLFDWLLNKKCSLKFVCFINDFNNAYLLNLDKTDRFISSHKKHFLVIESIKYFISDDNVIDIFSLKINLAFYIEICNKLNSHYFCEGFRSGSNDSGFYRGNIQLLSGNSVHWFFSLTKNVSQNTNSNLLRWVKSSFAGFSKLIGDFSNIEGRVLVLGFSAPIRLILLELNRLIPYDIELYSILTYDVPTKEEFSFILSKYSHVILITDVISTGSLIVEIVELIKNENKTLLGIITLLDALNIEKSYKWDEQIEHSDVNLLSFGQIEIPTFSENELFNTKYWIDPISQIPGEKDLLSEDIDHRIEISLNVLSRKKISKISHIVDGTRHSSVFFDLKELLKSNYNGILEKLLLSEIDIRLDIRNWANDFEPSAIIFPTGAARIEKISDGIISDREANSKSATNYYVKMIKNIWPNIEEIQVLRVFEPGGISRCAKIVDIKTNMICKKDLIIADDGIWSGKTFKSLLELAKSLKAKRIIFLPLLARLSKSDLDYWESIQSLCNNNENIEVCFIFPMFIPIPFYDANQCPYELTIRRLITWKEKNQTISSLVDRVISSLKGRDRSEEISLDEEYIKHWLKIRTYSELAAENQNALRILIDYIKHSNSKYALLALINVFLHEWHIIGRARLRHTISNVIILKCQFIIKNYYSNTELLIATLSLLRSIFPNIFIDSLSKLQFSKIDNIDLFERITIHLATFPAPLKTSRKYRTVLQNFSNFVMQFLIIHNSKPITERYKQVLLILKKIIRQSKVHQTSLTNKDAVIELFDLILNHYTLRHDTWSFVAQLTGNLSELDSGTFKQYSAKWDEICKTIMIEKIFPLLIKIKDILIITATPQDSILSSDIEYFLIDDDDESLFNLEDDINIVQTNLNYLINKPDSQLWISGLQKSASRIFHSIAGANSQLVKTISLLKEVNLNVFINSIINDIHLRFPNYSSANFNITISNDCGATILDDFIFAPKHLLDSCKINIIDNLYKYAFKQNDGNCNVKISLNYVINNNSNKLVSLSVINNGNELNLDAQQSEAAISLRNDLIEFGGNFPAPKSLNENSWRVSQSIIFLIW